ncbi:hypothetical protein P43SY_001561 [Pythium insidiosum]|uniref:GAF domain-containing protein n=1 Tax=Pythium insidiosum TaxID=114742 RepID=A0AAD5M631_PYTIN|nr:hypothetical protein P43SY_001561 [Pythium insidiosum]
MGRLRNRFSHAVRPLTDSSDDEDYCQPTHAPAELPESRPVRLSDRRLNALAAETAGAVQWNRLGEVGPAGWQWLENANGFAIYTRREAERFAVLAVGVVPCSVREVLALLHATETNEHVQKMEAFCGPAFRHGAVVHDVNVDAVADSVPILEPATDSKLMQLCVKTATFAGKRGCFARPEEWCYLDALYASSCGQAFEKTMTSLRGRDVFEGRSPERTRSLENMIMAYKVQPEPGDGDTSPPASRVHFFGELFTPRHFGLRMPSFRHTASGKSMKHRLLDTARRCNRLMTLVRRRRLGVQVLIDRTRLLPPTNVPCVNCQRHLLLAKQCRLCGNGVCEDCSAKYERARVSRGRQRLRLEMVRVCKPCMNRVDRADYEDLSAPQSPAIARDAPGAKSPAAILTELLHDALHNAPSPHRKTSVMNVIKHVLDREQMDSNSSASMPRPASVLLTEEDHLLALKTRLKVPVVPADQCELSNEEGRAYLLTPGDRADVEMASPIPPNDAQRNEAVRRLGVRDNGPNEELNIICDLAVKELQCFAAMITIVEEHEMFIASCTVPGFTGTAFSRAKSFCCHTVMDPRPNLVPNVRGDIRFHPIPPVQRLGVSYYCGFPLKMADGSIVGSLCFIDRKNRQLTESQFAALERLADTASRVLQARQGKLDAGAGPARAH